MLLNSGQKEMLKDLRDVVKIGNWPAIFRRIWIRTCFFEAWGNKLTTAVLNIEENVPSEKERLARVAIKLAKTVGQDLIRTVGMKSIEQFFGGMVERSLRTSAGVTVLSVSNSEPV